MNEHQGLIYVKYVDHVEFRNSNPHLFKPCVREVVGWLVKETEDALYLTYDRSVEPLPFQTRDCGLIILKSDVLEKRRIKAENKLYEEKGKI